MATLETRTAKINAVISLKDKSYETIKGDIFVALQTWCENNCDIFAFILHDSDILEDGTPKTSHIHLVAVLKTNRKRLSTTLSDLSSFISVNTLAITIDKMSDLVGSLQYLIHKNNPTKYQYQLTDIVTNITEGEMTTYMNSDSKSMSIEYLIDIVTENRSKIGIMRAIGLANYHLYRNVINDIYNEIYGNYA